jgi:pseudaminic acid cytidylyltransferase
MNRIFFIPARCGSQRIKKKNIREFDGKPIIRIVAEKLLLYSGTESSSIYISSDCDEILNLVSDLKLGTPIFRSRELATSQIGTLEVIKDFLTKFQKEEDLKVFCVYPTSIFLTNDNLSKAETLLERNSKSIVFPVAYYQNSPQRAMRLSENGKIELVEEFSANKPTQELERYWFDSSQFYLGLASTFLSSESLYQEGLGFEVSPYSFVDINTEDDWDFALHLWKKKP